METTITVQVVHGGFILYTPDETSPEKFGLSGVGTKTEVFTSQGKLLKALRTAIEDHSLIAKTKEDDGAQGGT